MVIRESSGNGFVTKVELKDMYGWNTVWEGTDPTLPGHAADFVLTFPRTAYLTQEVRITVDTDHALGEWEEIDAVRLLSGGEPLKLIKGTQLNNTRSPVATVPNQFLVAFVAKLRL